MSSMSSLPTESLMMCRGMGLCHSLKVAILCYDPGMRTNAGEMVFRK
jgi:hypothetical protein